MEELISNAARLDQELKIQSNYHEKQRLPHQGSVQICPFLKSFSPPEPSPPDRVGEKRRSKQRERGSRRNRNSIELRKKVC